MAIEQLLEGVSIASDMCGQQLRIRALVIPLLTCAVVIPLLTCAALPALPPEGTHSRTLNGAAGVARHIFAGLGMDELR